MSLFDLGFASASAAARFVASSLRNSLISQILRISSSVFGGAWLMCGGMKVRREYNFFEILWLAKTRNQEVCDGDDVKEERKQICEW